MAQEQQLDTSGRLTPAQRKTLKALHAKDTWVRSQGYGLNAADFGGKPAAAAARALAKRGLVAVTRYAPGHFRYAITEAGKVALEAEGGR